MATLRFRIVNVFTRGSERLSGNPLCVFEDGRGVDDAAMLALARQFNLSETTFILPSEKATARIRIFTPSYEMPFAGHPTLGSAHVVHALRGDTQGSLTLETKAGVIPVSLADSRYTLTANAASWRAVEGSKQELARALGLDTEEVGEPLWVNAGKEQLIVPLTSAAAIRRANPSSEGLMHFPSHEHQYGAYVFFEHSPGHVLARYFFKVGNSMLEDPATGSATANLGGYMLATQRALPLRFEIAQGEQAGRPSTLYLRVTEERRVLVAGDVIELATGVLEL